VSTSHDEKDLTGIQTGSGMARAEPAEEQLPQAEVVVGLDGSPSSWDAFWWACGEARRCGQRALAVFVSPAPGARAAIVAAACALASVPAAISEWEKAVSEQAALLRSEVERYAAERGLDVSFVHRRGDPAKELLWASEVAKADLIVVGRSCKARHHIAGSISRQLVSKANAPIVVVVP
jgi:nucleotide-binding universal stress UspA family protein